MKYKNDKQQVDKNHLLFILPAVYFVA